MSERIGRGEERECNAGIDGGCGACELCDPEWWERLRVEQASRLTVEECVYWLAVAMLCGASEDDAADVMACAAGRDVQGLRETSVDIVRGIRARRERPSHWPEVDAEEETKALTLLALCREAIRAIERERSGR